MKREIETEDTISCLSLSVPAAGWFSISVTNSNKDRLYIQNFGYIIDR